MSVIHNYTINSGDLTGLSQSGADISASNTAALGGSSYGLLVTVDDTTANYVYNASSPGAQTTGRARIRLYIDPNSMSMGSGTAISVFTLRYSVQGWNLALIQLVKVSNTYYIRSELYNDAGGTSGASYSITDAPHYVEIDVIRATNATSNNGTLQTWVDGVSQGTITGVDNYDRFANWEYFRWGAITKDASQSGTFYLDELIVNNDGGEIGPLSVSDDLTATNITTAAPVVGAPTIGQIHALTANGITTGAPTLDAPSMGGEIPLIATNIVTGAPTLGAPTIGQVHALTSAGITTAAPTLGAPTFGIVYVIDDLILEWIDAVNELTANGITTAAPTLGAPTLGQTHALIAVGITTSTPDLGAPVISQTHVLTAVGVTTTAPTLDAPTIGQVHALAANGITTGAPELGAPSMAGEAALTADGITTGSPTLGAPTIGQVHVFAANSITTSAPILGDATLGQIHVLIANGVTTPSPIFGAPSFGQAHVLTANGITTGAPTLGAPEEIVPVTDWLYVALSDALVGDVTVTDALVGDITLTDSLVWDVTVTDAQAL